MYSAPPPPAPDTAADAVAAEDARAALAMIEARKEAGERRRDGDVRRRVVV